MILLPAVDVWREPTEEELREAEERAKKDAQNLIDAMSLQNIAHGIAPFSRIALPMIRKRMGKIINELVAVQPMPEPAGPSVWMKDVLQERYDQSWMDTERPISDQEDALAMAVAGIRAATGQPPEPKFPKPYLIPSLKERVNLRRMRKGKS